MTAGAGRVVLGLEGATIAAVASGLSAALSEGCGLGLSGIKRLAGAVEGKGGIEEAEEG